MASLGVGRRISLIGRRIPRRCWFLAVALLLVAVAAWPIWSEPGLINTRGGGDSPFLLQRLQQLESALADQHFPVRWMPEANYGYGYPFFNYYAPLSIYLAAVFRFLGFSYIWSIESTQISGFVVACWAMFLLGRRWLGNNWAGLLAAAAYTLAPFHLVNVYVRGDSLAEFWAMAFFPLVILAADQLYRTSFHESAGLESRKRSSHRARIAILALAFAGLILSHNISALIFTPFLILFLILGAWPARMVSKPAGTDQNATLQRLKWPFMALTLGLALASWFWLPALAEQSLAQLEPVTAGYFHYANHFRGTDLLQSGALFDYDVAGGRAFRMGLLQALLIILGLVALVAWDTRQINKEGSLSARQGPSRSRQLFIIVSLLVATFMITPLSRPLWDNLPLLAFVQFPWRFLSVQAFAGALAIAGLALLPGRRFIVPIVIILMLVSSLANLQLDRLLLSDEDVTPERLALYEWFTGNIGSTVSAEYLPPSVQPRPYTSPWINASEPESVRALEGELLSLHLVERKATRNLWQINAGEATTKAVFPIVAWPGWEATVDGESVEIQAAPGSGLIMIDLASGEHEVLLRLSRTPVRAAAELLTLVSLVAALWLIRPIKVPTANRFFVAAIVVFLIVVVLIRLWPQRTPSGIFNWDFDQLAYLHPDEDGVAFEDGARLRSYSYSDQQVSAGEEIVVELDWATAPEGAITLSLTSPAVNRHEQAPLITSQSQTSDEDETVFQIILPKNAPAGLFMPRITVDGSRALTAEGRRRGDLFLSPLRIIDVPQLADSQDGNLDARTTGVSQRAQDVLDVQLQWLTKSPLSRNYNASLRLIDAGGLELAHFDGQPGYGFQPSSGWPAGQWIDDWLALPLPDELTPQTSAETPFALVARLYDVESGQVALTRRLGILEWQGDRLTLQTADTAPALPVDMTPAGVDFEGTVQLLGYTLSHEAGELEVVMYWEALAEGTEDLYHFVHIVDPATGEIVAQHDSMPRYNTFPTSQWSQGELVADPLTINLMDVPAGNYEVYAGLYRSVDAAALRLLAADDQGRPLTDDRVFLGQFEKRE